MSTKDYAKKLGQKKMLEFLEEQGARHNLYPEDKIRDVKKKEFDMKNREEPTSDMGFDSI